MSIQHLQDEQSKPSGSNWLLENTGISLQKAKYFAKQHSEIFQGLAFHTELFVGLINS